MDLGCSYNLGKTAIQQWILKHFPKQSTILDLGCGRGTYADLLESQYIIDGVDIYEPVIAHIINKYRTVYCMNIIDFPFLQNYDLIIMGDILEHLSVTEGQKFIEKSLKHCKCLLIAVPFEYPQGPIEDNKFEEHLQPDLNFDTIPARYPQLELLLYLESDKYAVYVDNGEPYPLKYAYYIAKGALYNE